MRYCCDVPRVRRHTHIHKQHIHKVVEEEEKKKKPLYTCSTASQTSLSSLLMNVNKSIMHRRIHAVNQAKARDSVFVHRLLLVKLIDHHIFCFQKATDSKLWQHNETRGLIDSSQTWLLLPGGQDGKFHREFGQIWKFHYSVMYGIEMFMTCLCFHSWSFALVPCTQVIIISHFLQSRLNKLLFISCQAHTLLSFMLLLRVAHSHLLRAAVNRLRSFSLFLSSVILFSD